MILRFYNMLPNDARIIIIYLFIALNLIMVSCGETTFFNNYFLKIVNFVGSYKLLILLLLVMLKKLVSYLRLLKIIY